MAKRKGSPAPLGKRNGRKVIGIEHTRNFVVEDLKDPPKKQVLRYRSKKLPDGHVLTFAVTRGKGPRGGRTKLINIKHPVTEADSANKHVERALRARQRRGGKVPGGPKKR